MFPQAAKVSAKTGMMQKSVISNDLIAVRPSSPTGLPAGPALLQLLIRLQQPVFGVR
jgi:hypothetical protein